MVKCITYFASETVCEIKVTNCSSEYKSFVIGTYSVWILFPNLKKACPDVKYAIFENLYVLNENVELKWTVKNIPLYFTMLKTIIKTVNMLNESVKNMLTTVSETHLPHIMNASFFQTL